MSRDAVQLQLRVMWEIFPGLAIASSCQQPIRPIPVSIAKLILVGLAAKARASSRLETVAMKPAALIAALSLGKRRAEDQNRLRHPTRAQFFGLGQVRDPKELHFSA